MRVQKYKAKIKGTQKEVIGYLVPIRKYLGAGSYSQDEVDYCISVNSLSMPNGDYGTFLVEKDSIDEFTECPICNVKETSEENGYFACSSDCYDEL